MPRRSLVILPSHRPSATSDAVSSGDHLADVETDKATMELQAFDDGTVARIDVEEGQTVPVGAW